MNTSNPTRTLLSFMVLLAATACGTPTARALQEAPTRTPYWSFLWTLQTAWLTLTPVSPAETPTNVAAATMTAVATQADVGLSPTSPAVTLPPHTESTQSPSASPISSISSLRAAVTAGFLSCRYGPGPEYLYLYALREGANISLIGRADGENWHWAWVDGQNKCWVNTRYLAVSGDWRQLPVVYPGIARLPISPYYPPTSVLSAVRSGNSVTVEWLHIPLRAGDEEDESMQHYILEAWHCVNGRLLFEPLATNDTRMTVTDEAGCASPSRARLFVQEKHGFSGPTSVPWPVAR